MESAEPLQPQFGVAYSATLPFETAPSSFNPGCDVCSTVGEHVHDLGHDVGSI